MKTLIVFLLMFLLSPISLPTTAAQETYFAKIINANVYFYAHADDESALFKIPQSYFVELYDREKTFYKARYLDLEGYVKIGQVSPMEGRPVTPYFRSNINVFALKGLALNESPNLESKEITALPYDSKDTIFYGEMEGNNIPNKSTKWYYCKTSSNQQGYLYSVFCDVIEPLTVNNENFTPITKDLFVNSNPASSGLSTTAKTFIILGVSLPCAFLIYLLIKPSLSGQTHKIKNKRPRRRHGDYFEFDEKDLS